MINMQGGSLINPSMKNFLHSVVSVNRQRKVSVSAGGDLGSPGKRYLHDSLVDEFNISLKGFESSNGDRIVYDCNANNLTENPKLKRNISFVRRSWRKKSGSKKESQDKPLTYKNTTESNRDSVDNSCDGSKEPTSTRVCGDTQSTSTWKTRSLSSVETPHVKNEKKKTVRRFSTSSSRKNSTTLFEDQTSSLDAIDFGSCHIPNEMKSWALIQQKLSNWSHRTSSPKGSHRRNFSFSETITEPAKNWVVNSLPTTLKRRKKSYECQKRIVETEIKHESLDEPNDEDVENIQDVSLTREIIDSSFITDTDISFSSNVWYYGEIDIRQSDRKNSLSSSSDDNDDDTNMNNRIGSLLELDFKRTGSILARIDKHGDVVYSITYRDQDDVIAAAIPFEGGKYCLDFSDPEQPRFSSPKFLIAHLMEKKFLQRVTFAWLIENSGLI